MLVSLALRGVSQLDVAIATVAFLLFVFHNIGVALEGHPYNALWVCDGTAGLVAVAIILRQPTLSTACCIGLLWGTMIWIGNFILTAGAWRLSTRITGFAMHAGGLAAAVYAVRRNGYAPHAWVVLLLIQFTLVIISRVAVPARYNINATRGIPLGWNFWNLSYRGFWVALSALYVGFALIGQALLHEVLAR